MSSRAYYDPGSLSAVFYDLVTAADTRLAGDIDVYARLAEPGAAVLELGCGAGRVAFALAERGFDVTGVDLAPAMLAQATARQAAAPAEVAARTRFLQGDLAALDLGRTFDLVLCPFFTLAHLPTQSWPAALEVMARHLAPGGRCAVHLPLARIMAMPGPPPTLPVMDEPLPGGGRLRLYVLQRAYDPVAGRLDQMIEYVQLTPAAAVLRRSAEQLTYYLADPLPLARAAGLTPQGKAIAHGGVGEIFVFRRS